MENEDKQGPRARPWEALSLVGPEQRLHVATEAISARHHVAK